MKLITVIDFIDSYSIIADIFPFAIWDINLLIYSYLRIANETFVLSVRQR